MLKPPIETNDIDELKAQIKGNPNCKLSGCHGKGVLGYTINKDGSVRINTCSCHYFEETEWVKVVQRINALSDKIDKLTERLNEGFDNVRFLMELFDCRADGRNNKMIDMTVRGTLRQIWHKIFPFRKGGFVTKEGEKIGKENPR